MGTGARGGDLRGPGAAAARNLRGKRRERGEGCAPGGDRLGVLFYLID